MTTTQNNFTTFATIIPIDATIIVTIATIINSATFATQTTIITVTIATITTTMNFLVLQQKGVAAHTELQTYPASVHALI